MISFNKLKALVITDLLQSNRQANQGEKKNKVSRSNLWWRVLLQNILFLFIYGLLFGTVMFNIPLPEFPGMFTGTINFMVLFLFLQVFQLIFNLFYDDNNNLSSYLALPFSLGELFLSKIITVMINTFALFILPLAFMIMLGLQAGSNIIYVVLTAFFSTTILMTVLIFIPLTFLHLLHKIPIYVKHKKVFTIILYTAMFLILFYFLYTNPALDENLLDTVPNPLYIGFYEMFVPGNYLSGWVKFGGWFVVAATLLVYTFKRIIPALYSDEGKLPAKRKKEKAKQSKKEGTLPYRSKWQVFVRYQLRQLQDTTFIMQLFFSKLYFPFIFIAPAIIDGNGFNLGFLSELSHFWGLYILIGFVFSLVIISETSIPGVIISFDKENYHYIKSLPMSFKQYIQYKYLFAYILEWLIGTIILGIVAFFLKLPFTVFFNLIIGLTLGTYLVTMYYYMRDYRLLNLDWSNFTELMQRGMNQFIRMFFTFILFLLAAFALFGLSFWLFVQNQPMLTLGISILIAVVLILITYGMYRYSKQKFWINFDS